MEPCIESSRPENPTSPAKVARTNGDDKKEEIEFKTSSPSHTDLVNRLHKKIEEKSHTNPPRTREHNLINCIRLSADVSLPINDFKITCRASDGFVDATDLCKANETKHKQFNDWYRLTKTNDFLRVLSLETGIPVSELVIIGRQHEHTFVHPQVAVNIAQWISPIFDVKVSKWIYELMMTGSVKLGNERTTAELDAKHLNEIQLLENQFNEKLNNRDEKIAELQYELTNYDTTHYIDNEQKVIDAYNLVYGAFKLDKRIHKYIFYVLYVGQKMIDGVLYNIYKFGISESGALRMSTHRASFGDAMRKLLIYSLTFGGTAENHIIEYLRENGILIEHRDLKGHRQKEIFYTRPDLGLQEIILHCIKICEKETSPSVLKCTNTDLARDNKELKTQHTNELKNQQKEYEHTIKEIQYKHNMEILKLRHEMETQKLKHEIELRDLKLHYERPAVSSPPISIQPAAQPPTPQTDQKESNDDNSEVIEVLNEIVDAVVADAHANAHNSDDSDDSDNDSGDDKKDDADADVDASYHSTTHLHNADEDDAIDTRECRECKRNLSIKCFNKRRRGNRIERIPNCKECERKIADENKQVRIQMTENSNATHKKCSGSCRETKPITDFHKDRNVCKKCVSLQKTHCKVKGDKDDIKDDIKVILNKRLLYLIMMTSSHINESFMMITGINDLSLYYRHMEDNLQVNLRMWHMLF